MITIVTFWLCLSLGLMCCFRIFWDLSDFSQLLNIRHFPRSQFMKTWYARKTLKLGAILGAIGALAINHYDQVISMPVLVALLAIGFLFYYAGIINPVFMMPSKQHTGKFVPIDEAKQKVRPHNLVMVIENNGQARAHPDFEMWRPHIAGDNKGLGGENIIMTYCSLSNLGMAFRPEIQGQKLDLKVATQLENNLLMWDKVTGEPVQQIMGHRECNIAASMPEFPSFTMTFGDFCHAYPDGEVFVEQRTRFFHNPIAAVHDLVMDMLFYFHIAKQRNNDDFLFNTIKHHDSEQRLHRKEQVWGLNIGEDYVCYSKDFIAQQGGIINTRVGGQRIVINIDKDYDVVSVWHNPSNQDITKIDFFGRWAEGELARVATVKSGVFYGVWYNFFPHTEVNRL